MSTPSGPPALRWLLLATHVPAGAAGGGVVRYTVELARALARREDVDLTLLVRSNAAASLASETGARVLPLPGALPRTALSVLERFGTTAFLRGRTFDVVQGAKHLVPLTRRPWTTVLTAHDTILLDRPQDFDLAKRWLLQRPYRDSLRSADVVLNVSDATRRGVHRHARPRGASEVVWLATSPALLSQPAQAVPALQGRRFALVVGDPSPRKNLPLLVDSWNRVLQRDAEAVLAVVGPDSWGDTVHGAAFDDLVRQDRLVRLSGLSDAQLRWTYENAVVALCPSRSEGFGLPAVEALDLGTPLITSTDPALMEVSGPEVLHLSPDATDAWVDAVGDAFTDPSPRVPRARPRTWDDVAAESVRAVRAVRD